MEKSVFLGRYRLSLGRNGQPIALHRADKSVIYRAQQIDSGREVAIELVPWPAPDPTATADLETEAAAAKQISHLNIPVLHDFGIEQEQLVYVTDYVEGHTAQAWVAARGALPVGAVLRVGIQVVSALSAANFHRIHHPALNPANLLFIPGQTAEGDWPAIKVLHWLGPAPGIAESGGDTATETAASFASPEQLRGEGLDFASEVYSLGATMWFLLTGAPPAAPGGGGVSQQRLEKLRGVPKIVRHLLGRMLRLNPAERPKDPVVLEAYLQTCLARVERREAMSRRLGVPVMARPRVAIARRFPALPRKQLALAALLLLCGTLLALTLPRFVHSQKLARAKAAANLPPNLVDAPELATTAAPTVAPAVNRPADVSVVKANTGAAAIPQNQAATEPAAPREGPEEIVAAATPPRSPVSPKSAPIIAQNNRPNESLTASPVSTAPPPEVVAATPVPPPPSAPKQEVASIAKTDFAPEDAFTTADAVTAVPPTPAPVSAIENTPHVAADFSSEKQPTREDEKGSARVSHRERTKHHAAAARSKEKEKIAGHSHRRKQPRIAREVRRGRKIPQLRVGGDRAEMVGTTPDGRWILSVANSGERIIVPPPPGFAQ